MSNVTLYNADCLDILKTLPAGSVDAVITDLPYGTTACKWDEVIPFVPMWEQVKRVLKPRGVFVTTASQPFTSKLVMSNPEWFRYEWIWQKEKGTGHLDANRRPLRDHENIAVFSAKMPVYNPQFSEGKPYFHGRSNGKSADVYSKYRITSTTNQGQRYPKTVIRFRGDSQFGNSLHPTQKPVALYEYLIRTYTNEGDTVADICCGSGTTGVACVQTGRNFIGIEIDPGYYRIAEKRIADAQAQPLLLEAAG